MKQKSSGTNAGKQAEQSQNSPRTTAEINHRTTAEIDHRTTAETQQLRLDKQQDHDGQDRN